MTFDLILSSLLYHGREWFVFQDILTHLPQEKAAAATQRSKTTSEKYTYRFGITRDWVTGVGKKILVDRHFIDSNDSGRSLVFSSVLIDAARVQELFLDSFNKRFRLKVQQFHLTATSLNSTWFEWQFDPKQKDGSPLKKTKLTEENNRQSSKTLESDNEKSTPDKSVKNRPTPLAQKRRRPALESGDQTISNYSPTISESVLIRPRKKAKEANFSISKYLDEPEVKPDIEHKKEPMSPDYKPDMANFDNVKRSASPIDKSKVKLSPSSSSQQLVKGDAALDSVANDSTDSNIGYIPPANDETPETGTTAQQINGKSQNTDNVNENGGSTILDSAIDNLCQDRIGLDDQDNIEVTGDEDGETENIGYAQQNTDNVSDNNSTVDYANSSDNSNNGDSNIPDSNVPEDPHPDPQSDQPTSPISPLVDNAKNIMENINLQQQELCGEEECVGVNGQLSEAQSTSADTSTSIKNHQHDCGAEACSSNGASSTVCLCTNNEKSKTEASSEKMGNSGTIGLILNFCP